MTKADMAERIDKQLNCSKKQLLDYLESVLALMKNTLKSGKNLKISGFGNFVVKLKTDRRGRNPQTAVT